jgi:drug/metabolite transporter (DMT)-like permease
LAIIAGFLLGAYQMFHRKAGQQLGVMRGMMLLLVTCVVVATLIMLITVRPLTAVAMSWRALLMFALAGIFHFIFGFTFLTISQHRVGASRTGILVGSTPLFATVVGFLVLGEVLGWWTIAGIGMIVVGVVVVSDTRDVKKTSGADPHGLTTAAAGPADTEASGVPATASGVTPTASRVVTAATDVTPAASDVATAATDVTPAASDVATAATDVTPAATGVPAGTPLFGLLSAVSFSFSAVFIRMGIDTGTPPIVGLWIGFVCAAILFAPLAWQARRRETAKVQFGLDILSYEIMAAIFITVGMWLRYVATRTVPVGVVTALARLNIPIILIFAPLFLRNKKDSATLRLWIGSVLVIAGATLVVFVP